MRIRGERRKGGVVIPVDGAPRERAVVAGGTQPLADGTVPARVGDPAGGDRDEATAERFYQPFQGSVIARIEAGRWTLATRPRLARDGIVVGALRLLG